MLWACGVDAAGVEEPFDQGRMSGLVMVDWGKDVIEAEGAWPRCV